MPGLKVLNHIRQRCDGKSSKAKAQCKKAITVLSGVSQPTQQHINNALNQTLNQWGI